CARGFRPRESAYWRYVSMDAPTTHPSIWIRSMPTSDTRPQPSMTTPLSRTRSRTSMKLLLPGLRSTYATVDPSALLRPDDRSGPLVPHAGCHGRSHVTASERVVT